MRNLKVLEEKLEQKQKCKSRNFKDGSLTVNKKIMNVSVCGVSKVRIHLLLRENEVHYALVMCHSFVTTSVNYFTLVNECTSCFEN